MSSLFVLGLKEVKRSQWLWFMWQHHPGTDAWIILKVIFLSTVEKIVLFYRTPEILKQNSRSFQRISRSKVIFRSFQALESRSCGNPVREAAPHLKQAHYLNSWNANWKHMTFIWSYKWLISVWFSITHASLPYQNARRSQVPHNIKSPVYWLLWKTLWLSQYWHFRWIV